MLFHFYEHIYVLKTWIRRIHLVLAFSSAIFLLNLSISGALLLYAKDIQAFANPSLWQITPEASNQKKLPLSQLVRDIELKSNDKIRFIEQSEIANGVWQVRLTNNNYLNINPYNGNIVLRHNYYDTFYGFIMAWHRWLLYETENTEKPLKPLISIASLILIIELIIGLYLWIKPKNRLKRLKIKWRSKAKVRFYQLHTTLGVFTCIPLILIAFSGMAFHWQPATKQIVEWLSFSEIETKKLSITPSTTFKDIDLDKAYQTAHSALSEGNVYRVYLPLKAGEPLALRIKMPDESHANSWSWSDPVSGNLLDSFDASKASMATKIWNFKYKFHIGEFIAWPIKILWLLLSLLPSFFVTSGLYLFIKRRGSRRL